MIDNEIIKCAEECLKDVPNCKACPFNYEGDCRDKLLKLCLDLINRQQTEIERWKNEAICYQDLWCEGMTDVQTAKSEAYKEFAERVKEMPCVTCCEYEWVYTDIDNLVKELTEGSNGE